MSEFMRTENKEGVATVTLARQELHNAFNDAMIADLRETFTSLGNNPTVRVIVLAAEGKSFCAGADLNWMKSMLNYTYEENVKDAQALAKMLKTIDECPKPVIGRIHGACFGGGVGLVSVCDMAVAVETASFCLSEVKLGLLPAVISPFVLSRISGTHARRYFLTAERFPAIEAHRIGLVSNVVSDVEALDKSISDLIQALFQNGPEAVSLCKKLIREVNAATSVEDALTLATHRIAERRISDEGQEGMRSFLEKRPSSWLQPEPGAHVS
jgi:methylglutaconyl-CoA hydratase